MPRRRIGPVELGVDRVRIGFELLGLGFILVLTPVAVLLTSRSELQRVWPLWLLAYALLIGSISWDVGRTVRAHRRAAAPVSLSDQPRKDALWERRDEHATVWRALRALGVPLARHTSGHELRAAVLRESRALPLGTTRPDVSEAAEAASVALGMARPPSLFWSPGSGTNAIVTGTSDESTAVLGESMLASFTTDELCAVMASLLSRVRQGAADSLNGRVGRPAFMWPSDRPSPGLVLAIYQASDVEAVLALRDPDPVRAALLKTSRADPFMPGLTVDQAQLMWTWPSSAAPLMPRTTAAMLQTMVDVVTVEDEPVGRRIEVLRLEALSDAGAGGDGPLEDGDESTS